MKILVIGSGGREHALLWKIAQSPFVTKLFAAPGNAGTEDLAQSVTVKADDLEGLLNFAELKKIDLTVVGPEIPLVQGISDLFQKKGLLVFGPQASAAQLEGSKVFSKDRMKKYGVPTAAYKVFQSSAEAKKYILEIDPPFVIKADGLAAGKGVIVADSAEEGVRAVTQILDEKIFGQAGKKIVIEEFLKGEELSILAFSDGKNIVPLASSQDHKRVGEHDHGPNTGGMGAYSPCPLVNEKELKELAAKTIQPVISGLFSEGMEYRGLIYAGLMLTDRGPFVLEYNVRFGDPEAQAVLTRLDEDLVPILMEAVTGKLRRDRLLWKPQSSMTVVLASAGYPGVYATGFPISGLAEAGSIKDVIVFHAGTRRNAAGQVVTAGGRVLNVTAWGDSLQEAHASAYEAVKKIHFDGMFCRKDIGWRAFTIKSR